MELFEAIKGRVSCRSYSSRPVEDEKIRAIIESGTWAPSPANRQPWEFIVIKNADVRHEIAEIAGRKKVRLFEMSGWKWIDRYSLDFLTQAPVMIAVIADPAKSGADTIEDGGESYKLACATAVQNMLLAAHALGLGSLYYTMYFQQEMRDLLGVTDKDVAAVLPIGYAEGEIPKAGRQDIEGKISVID